MHRNLKMGAAGAALVATTMFTTATVVSQEHGGQDQPSMEQLMTAAMMPGPEHEQLAEYAGKWKSITRHWDVEAPAADPSEDVHWADYHPILGGRYMLEKVHGKMTMYGREHDFEGLGIFGFDNMHQKHFFIWIDTFGTGYMIGEGQADETGNVITYYSDMEWGGQHMKFKSVATIHDDESSFEMYLQTPDGWWKNMEVRNQRVASKR